MTCTYIHQVRYTALFRNKRFALNEMFQKNASKGEQNFFFQINSKTLILRYFFLNFIFSTTFPLINYRGIKGSFENHILKNASCFS